MAYIRVESGLDDLDNLGTWVTFWRSSRSHPQTELSGCDPDITCLLVLASGKWVNFRSDECTEISLVWNYLIISNCFEAYGVWRFHLQEVCARDRFCILPRMKESMALFHIKKFSCHVILATFKKKTSTCGHKWVICGSHPDYSVVSGSMGQQVWSTFNPGTRFYALIFTIIVHVV